MSSGVVNRVVAVDALGPHPLNYNRHDEGQIADLRLSLREFGQVRSIVVQPCDCVPDGCSAQDAPGYLIVAGHGLAAAARAEGLRELRADVIPAEWAEGRVLAYLAADNELARQGNPDAGQLAALVARVRGEAGESLAQLAAGSEARMREMLKAITLPEITDWEDSLGELPTGDRSPIQQMTFTVADDQAETIKAALAEARRQGPFVNTGNDNSNGNALARICETYLNGR